MEEGLNTFKICYCDFINQLVLYDDQNNTIKTYVDKINSSDNLISDILNDMIDELPTYIDRIKENDWTVFDKDSEIKFLNDINIKTFWENIEKKDKKQVFSHIDYCFTIGKFVMGKATLNDIRGLYSIKENSKVEEVEEEDNENIEIEEATIVDENGNVMEEAEETEETHVITEEEQEKIMQDLNGITNDLEEIEKMCRNTLGDENLNKMQQQIQNMIGNIFTNNTENTENTENNENTENTENNENTENTNPLAGLFGGNGNEENPLAGLFGGNGNGENPLAGLFGGNGNSPFETMANDIKSKIDSGEIDENALEKSGEQMMQMIGNLSESLGPMLSNIMGGAMGGSTENNQKQDPLGRAMGGIMNAMSQKEDGENPFANILSSLGGTKLSNDEKSNLRREERLDRNRKEAEKKYKKKINKKLRKKLRDRRRKKRQGKK